VDSPQPADPGPRRPGLLDRIAGAVRPTYGVQRELGRGTTATVFLADDRKHGRRVAVKVLDPLAAGGFGVDRFLDEIRIAARLAHPHILPVLDSGVADGVPYYVMPFVEGETLRGLLDREGLLSVDATVRWAAEIAGALDYAHAAGIVHRDVKPENILLLEHHAVLADFGVARAVSAGAGGEGAATGANRMVGTLAYMSPEQAGSDVSVDGRTDQFALAVVVYEMLCGKVPFAATSAVASIARRLVGSPPSVRAHRPDLPAALDAALGRALSAEPAHRFDTVGAFVAALGGPGRAAVPDVAVDANLPSIAVLPFANGSGDPEMAYFSEGITDEIVAALSKVRQLRVAARSSSYALYKESADARTFGERLGVRTILEGSVRRAGPRVRVSAHLVSTESGYQLWSDQYDRTLDDVFAIQDDIARAIVRTLEVRLLGDAQRPLVVSTTRNQSAYDAYLRGTHANRSRTEAGLRASVDLFREALRIDPELGDAQVGLADSLLLLAVYGVAPPREVMPAARAAAEDALHRDPTRAEAWVCLGSVLALYEHDWPAADDAFRRAVLLAPRSPSAHQRYALDCLVPRGELARALEMVETACSLDPLSPVMRTSEAMVRYFAGDLEAARRAADAAAGLDRYFAMAEYFLGTIARDAGEPDVAAEAFTRAIALTGGTPEMVAGLAQTHAGAGRVDEAEALRAQLAASTRERFVSPTLLAQVDAALGRTTSAMEWLAEAVRQADPEVIYLTARPVYRTLASDAGYRALVEQVGLAPASWSAAPGL
jgi:serine/threonine protein kinase/tetratricopeptide (TPR) repeat protein